MKYLKTLFGLFVVLYFPFLVVAAIVLKPRDPKMTQIQAALASALPFAVLMFVVAGGFAVLTYFMDLQKASTEKAEATQKASSAPKKKKKKKK